MEYFCSFLRIFATKVHFLVEITKFFANNLLKLLAEIAESAETMSGVFQKKTIKTIENRENRELTT
jgi:hypothetical protein